MKLKKLLVPLFILASSLSLIGCESVDEDDQAVSAYELMWYYPFDEYLTIEQPNYEQRSAYHRVNLTGHELTSFDEEENIVKFVHSREFTGGRRLTEVQFKKTDRYITITCGDFGRPIEENGIIKIYDNGYLSTEVTSKIYKNAKYFFRISEETTNKLFEIVEEDLAKIERGERHYYEDIKERYCSLDTFLETADKDLARESDYCNLDVETTHPYRVVSGYISHNYTDTRKTTAQAMIDRIKTIPHTFKGYKSVDYDAIRNSLFAIDYNDEYASYGYILEGGANFSVAGVTKVYGDYVDGKYHFLIAEYEIPSEMGQEMYDTAYAPMKNLS